MEWIDHSIIEKRKVLLNKIEERLKKKTDDDSNDCIRVTINIPRKYERDFSVDRFEEFFGRVVADIDCSGLCGKCEKETAEMLKEAFNNAKLEGENK